MKKFILLFLGCAQICFGMFPKPKVAHHKLLIATQQPKFKIEYLALKRSFFAVKDSAFSYMSEINIGLDFGPMHYFEAKMRVLQANGSEYLRSIKAHIQNKITELGDKNTQKPIMLKHIGFIDQVLSEPDIQRIDSYRAIKKLLRNGEVDQAVSAISTYRTQYGDAESAIALQGMIDSVQTQPRSTGGAVEALQTSSTTLGKQMDMQVGELPSSLGDTKYSHFFHLDSGEGEWIDSQQEKFDCRITFHRVEMSQQKKGWNKKILKRNQYFIDPTNGECYINDVHSRLVTLKNGKDDWVQLPGNQIGVYKDKILLVLPEGVTVEWKGKRYSNFHGVLQQIVPIHSNKSTSQPKADSVAIAKQDSATVSDIFKEKAKLFGLDTAQDFKSIGDAVLEHCDFVLTGLSDQSVDNIQAIKQEFELEIESARNAESLEEFSYHLSAVDLRLEMAKHILEYKELHPELTSDLLKKIDRSSELLGRAIASFVERTQENITHPHREIYHRVMAPIHLARLDYSVSKIAVQYGYGFFSSESKWEFVCNTWNSLCDLGSHITADDFFDGLGVLAAEVMTQRGLSKVCRYLSKLELAAETVGKGKDLLQKIENGFDRVLKKSPMPIPAHAKIPAAEIIADLKGRGITVPGLSQKSINTMRALKEHPLYYVLRRNYRDIRKYEHLYENKFKGFGPFANQYVKFPWKHILAPDFKKVRDNYLAKFNGWHHDYNDIIEKSGLIEFVDKRIARNKIAEAITKWRGVEMPPKTFFPPGKTTGEVMKMISEAYEHFLAQGAQFKTGKYGYIAAGMSEGIKIEMFFSFQGVLKTCYPLSK